MQFCRLIFTSVLGVLVASLPAHAQSTPHQGFQLNRYEPTAAGEWSFAVEHPWYSGTRSFAAGLTLNYAHRPLVYGVERDGFTEVRSIYDHQFIGHVDLAGSFLDRVLLTMSLPVVFATTGEAVSSGASVGDPRIGALIRILGQPSESIFSLSVAASVWLPLGAMTGALPATSNDQGARFVLPKFIAGGVWQKLLWSSTLGFMYRSEAVVADRALPPELRGAINGRAASEIELGLAASYYDPVRRFAVGPEFVLAGAVMGRDSASKFGTSLEALIAGHYHLAQLVQVGLALGGGFVRQAGTPDFRMLLRVAYAPLRKKIKDRDGDGISDGDDACPDERGVPSADRRIHGCPFVGDRDADGILDPHDTCPDEAQGYFPDPQRLGCPLPDRDHDGVLDSGDACPDTAQGNNPDPVQPGCPLGDRDGDGILDRNDYCPDVPQGGLPDSQRLGCPAPDTDGDGALDPLDLCPQVPAGLVPDPQRRGCPLPDRDKDGVADEADACPDRAGSPHTDPRKNGCPGLAVIEGGRVRILKPVFFAFDKAVILAESYPTLQAVVEVLKAVPTIRRLRVEGHTDGAGNRMYNIDLSDRRAASVLKWLIEHGIESSRVYSQGFGPDRPIDTNATSPGRAKNRRVVFEIVEGGGATAVPPK